MEKKFIATGKDFDSAVQAALRELGLELENVSVQLLERAKSGVFGIGARPCKVEVTYGKIPDPAPHTGFVGNFPYQSKAPKPDAVPPHPPTPPVEKAGAPTDRQAGRTPPASSPGACTPPSALERRA